MSSYRRRAVLSGLASLVALSGCSLVGSESERAASPPSDETSISPSSHSETAAETETPPQTSTSGVFTDLNVETDRTWCPADYHWEPAYHRTPMPPPEQPALLTQEETVEYVRSYEDFVLTYLAVDEHGPETPHTVTPNEPEVLAFPEADMRDSSAAVVATSESAFVVHMTYTRVIEGVSQGPFTANYYVSPQQTIRAEADGEVSPGPNPAKSGLILEC